MIGWRPSDDFIEKSRARLTSLFKQRLEQNQALLNDQRPQKAVGFTLLRNLVKEDKDIEKVVKNAQKRSADRAKLRPADPDKRKIEPRTSFGSIDVAFVPPYNWGWTWSAQTGTATSDVGASIDGTMNFDSWTGNDGKTASGAVAVGVYFRPGTTSYMDVRSNPSFNYIWDSDNVLDSSHSHAFLGIYVGEYTLGGDFVQAVIDQQINMWDSGGGSGQGSNSGYALFGSTNVDSDHFYEIWVWAGGDAEADGWSLFWGSAALSAMNIFVPSIEIHVY